MKQEDGIFWKFSNWYFSKKVLPYWVILMADTLVVFLSCMLTYWVVNKSQVTFDHHIELLVSSALYARLETPQTRPLSLSSMATGSPPLTVPATCQFPAP